MLNRLAANTWFAYLTILLLQLKAVNGMWLYRDISIGDTGMYTIYAGEWFNNFSSTIAWSPLYTLYYGFLRNFFADAYTLNIAHRLILVCVLTLLLLVVLRRLLPANIAWLMAAWWAVTPVVHNTLYEVHLFAVLPTLIGLLFATMKSRGWTRGAVIAVLLIAAVLVRNETFIALIVWSAGCIVWEVKQFFRLPEQRKRIRYYLLAYGVPALIAVSVIGFFYGRSTQKFMSQSSQQTTSPIVYYFYRPPEEYPDLSAELALKHNLNICQIYAYNYQQRFDDWTLSPWTECQDLMRRDFGVDQPSMMQAIRLNPRAMLDYFLWNVRLIPDGLQILLFDATSGSGQPDYIPRNTGSLFAGVMGIVLLLVITSGLVVFWRQRRYWWEIWFRDRAWAWLFFLGVICIMSVVMIMQRPRPSYMMPLFIVMLAFIGSCIYILSEKMRWLKNVLLLQPIFAIALIIFLPPYYTPEYATPHTGVGRPFYTQYTRLIDFRNQLEQIDDTHRFVMRGDPNQLCMFILERECLMPGFGELLAAKTAEISLGEWLAQQHVALFYIDEHLMTNPEITALLENAEATGWEILAEVHGDAAHWALIHYTGGH